MKRFFLPAALAAIVFLSACGQAAATPTPIDVPAISTDAVGTVFAALTQSAPTATIVPTLAATDTPTATSTPDYSVIKYDHLYFSGSTKMVIVFALNGATGEFHVIGNNYTYDCKPSPDNSDKLLCTGAFQAPGREVIFQLFEASLADPILTADVKIPSLYPPTPVGMQCEIEPLAGFGFPANCYAVTCYLNGIYVNEGTPNTCDQPWRYGPVP